jgi:photosystem II stability/assembly factor-like uncharacterized protein
MAVTSCDDKKEPEKAPQPAEKPAETKPAPAAPEPPKEPPKPAEEFAALETSLDDLPALEVTVGKKPKGAYKRIMKPKRAPKYGAIALHDLFVLDAKHAWAVGNYETLLRTTNGKKWKVLKEKKHNMRSRHPQVYFESPTKGYTTDGKSFVTTDDGGKTWKEVGKAHLSLGSVHFVGQDVVWSVQGERAWRSLDGGKTWKISMMPSFTFFRQVLFTNDARGWLLGMKSNKLNVWRTGDGGDKWVKVMGLDKDQRRRDPLGASAVDDNILWIAGENNLLVYTDDAGKTWKKVTGLVSGDAAFQDVYFFDANHGWVLAYQHKAKKNLVLHTEDGGKTWSPQKIKTGRGEALRAFSHDGKRAWVAGDAIYRAK